MTQGEDVWPLFSCPSSRLSRTTHTAGHPMARCVRIGRTNRCRVEFHIDVASFLEGQASLIMRPDLSPAFCSFGSASFPSQDVLPLDGALVLMQHE